ncbi:MAG: hypothetical protein NTW49_04200 [Bacteroidia bacterium]|nr:hypothetical protein [Bacteroidia bacterium]
MNFRRIIIILLCSLYSAIVFSQGEIDSTGKIFYRNEKSIGFYLSSDGLGGGFRYAIHNGGYYKYLFECDFNWIQDRKEIKTTSAYYDQKSFVFGKLNSFYTFRIGTGIQKEIFSKFDKGGIAIKYYYTIGPVIGILKPKYYEVNYVRPVIDSMVVENFQTYYYDYYINHENADIIGNASFLEGIDKTKFKLGVYVKFGFCFEYGKKDNVLNAIETGVSIDAFPDKIPIMMTDENYRIFPSFFISYRFGRIFDPTLRYQK